MIKKRDASSSPPNPVQTHLRQMAATWILIGDDWVGMRKLIAAVVREL
ncbi:hypothetical protein GWK36_04920 [Caldichromatium japonicum]|uniref:Uncharacterized protein n=1 Tax=Caldichromatium japonicum TaxID=2699430 RepID=A0A6G7VBN8_9GAMM|nr:hypothetical protein [Caldichromatium japonicum]QIK37431.1 hypothetical protein GWK36_04920 [Caldichromatium japonicum]